MYRKRMFALLLGVFLFTGLAVAQPKPPSKKQKLDFLTKKLDLNEQQVKTIDQILTSSKKQLDQLRDKREDFRKQSMKEMKQIFDQEDAQIEKNLTDSQKKVFAELKKDRENHRPPMGPRNGERGERPQGPPPPQGR